MELDCMLKALGEPMRLKIYQALLERKHCVRSLSKKLGVSESAISQHMKVMKDAGLVYGEKFGYHTHYLPLQDAADFLADQFQKMQTASLTVDRDMTVCQCEYRKEDKQL
ncbi:MAG: winged helix-turn-helix transcriptional regulator [Clostridia bacterium]|nr:winged helix-turn-helix transcriptional regulator [Clostridia bacterium]